MQLTTITSDVLAVPTLSALSVALIQWLKKSTWFPWLSDTSGKWALRIMSAITGLTSAAAIHYTFNAGTLTITGLEWASIAPAVWAWTKSVVFNELVFQAGVKAPGNAAQANKTSAANNTMLSNSASASAEPIVKPIGGISSGTSGATAPTPVK